MKTERKQFSPFELMGRVYEAAKLQGLISGSNRLTEIARLLEETPQTVKNWDVRGPSAAGLLKIQQSLNISATWVLYGDEPMLLSRGSTAQAQSSIGTATISAQAWPLEGISQDRWNALTERQKGRVEAAALAELRLIEAEQATASTASTANRGAA